MTKLDQSPRHRPANNYRGPRRHNTSNPPPRTPAGHKQATPPHGKRTSASPRAAVPERRAQPERLRAIAANSASDNADPTFVFKEFQKIVNSAKESFEKDGTRAESDENVEELEARIHASNLLNEEIARCIYGMFPGSIEADHSITEYDNVSLNESIVSSKSGCKLIPSKEAEHDDNDIKEVDENPALGTLETIQDAERRLNVHIAAWFKKHLDNGNAFENIMADYFKLKEQRKGLYQVPYLSYELDTTHKETYGVRANRINPEDYRGMRFIICDQPTTGTLEDFWRLVWKERARAVVSLQFDGLEGGMSFPADYWPNRANAMLQFGDFIVKYRGCRYKTAFMHTTNPASDKHVYRTTSLSIYNTKKLRVRANNIENEIDRLHAQDENPAPEDDYLDCFECHTIKHICFERWPDLLIPIPWSFVNSHSDMGLLLSEQVLKQELRNHQRFRGPVVVHTPVGNSRAITFIALKHSLARLFFDRVVDVPSSVLNVFKQRNHGNISSCQFLLLNLLVMEEALRRCMVDNHYRQKVDRLWDELIYYIGRKYGYALSTYYRGVRMITE
uniref:Tyrosine-protein phosphatase domain-containing protein n=1 Tax=Panagrellus redivivus TaxID=6233 RepID=A0A7E4V3F8_PANRE